MASPDDLVHCPICLEVFDQPRALPCVHTFCNTCLQEYITAAMRATPASTAFDCPVCRRKTDPPGSAHYSEWSKLFPVNHLIVTLLDSRDDLRQRKQLKEHSETDKTDCSEENPLVTSLKPGKPAERKQSVTNVETTNKIRDDESDFKKGHGNNLETCMEEEKVILQRQDQPRPPSGPSSSSDNNLQSPSSKTYQPQPPHGLPPAHIGHPPPHHWPPPPPHHGPPPPHHGPPPPHHGFPPPHLRPPPPHHRHPSPYHGGPPHHRGCHGPPHGGPGGRMHHPHGPRHHHHHPRHRRGCPP